MRYLHHVKAAAREVLSDLRQSRTRLVGYDRIQLGSGPHPLKGWANLDLGGPLFWDLTQPLPVKGRPIRFVYSEHFIEHVTHDQAKAIFANCRAIMAPGATIRISTPDLKVVTDYYVRGEIMAMEHGSWFPETPCRMLNDAFHAWGHQFLYDQPELSQLLVEAGFENVRRMGWRESDIPELRNLETRPFFGDLIVEGTAF